MLKRIFYRTTDPEINRAKPWSMPAEFDETWKRRIEVMAAHLINPAVVADFGCGMMWLENFLRPGQKYLPIDYLRRDERTLVLDLNRDSLQNVRADAAFLSGVLEYVQDVPAFAGKLAALPLKQIVLSYCTTDKHPDIEKRRNLNWTSHESLHTLLPPFLEAFNLGAMDDVKDNTILVFMRKA